MKQIIKNEDLVILSPFIIDDILFKHQLNNVMYKITVDDVEREYKKYKTKEFNTIILRGYVRDFIKEEEIKRNKSRKDMDDDELSEISSMFTKKFLEGEYIKHPHLYINI